MGGSIDSTSSGDAHSTAWTLRIGAAKEGDREVLGQLLDDLRACLCAFARGRLDPQLRVKISASDIVQEAALEAIRSFTSFRGQSRADLHRWIQGIVENRARTANRSYRLTGKRGLSREVRLDEAAHEQRGPRLEDGFVRTPSSCACRHEELSQLRDALRELPPRYEHVIHLRNELRLSFLEIAAILDCSENAAQKTWSRAIGLLSQRMNAGQ